jgi:hypothetical protein
MTEGFVPAPAAENHSGIIPDLISLFLEIAK